MIIFRFDDFWNFDFRKHSKIFSNNIFEKIFPKIFFVKMKIYFCSRFFSMISIVSQDFRKIIQSTRWCSSMLRRWIMYRDSFSKWKKISGFSRKIMLWCMDFLEFSHYLQWLCRVWVNWSHGSQGRMKNFLFFNKPRRSSHQKKMFGIHYDSFYYRKIIG